MILYGVFRMRVGNVHWLTSYDIEICGGLGFIFRKVICVCLCTLLEKSSLLCKRRDVGQFLF